MMLVATICLVSFLVGIIQGCLIAHISVNRPKNIETNHNTSTLSNHTNQTSTE